MCIKLYCNTNTVVNQDTLADTSPKRRVNYEL